MTFWKLFVLSSTDYISCHVVGGLLVIVLATEPRFTGSNPAVID
jgi:hypothetical protein